MKNKSIILMASFFISLTAFSQVRHGPPIDTEEPEESRPEPIVQAGPESEKIQPDPKEVKLFEERIQKLYGDIKSNWRKCVSPEAPLPKSLLDAHAQMTYFLTPSPIICDEVEKKKVLCLLDKKEIRRDLKQLKKLPIIKELVLHDKSSKLSVVDLIDSLEKMTKKD